MSFKRIDSKEKFNLQFFPEELQVLKKSVDSIDYEKLKKHNQKQIDNEIKYLEKRNKEEEEGIRKSDDYPMFFMANIPKVREKIDQSNGELSLNQDELVFLNYILGKSEHLFDYKDFINPYFTTLMKITMNAFIISSGGEPEGVESFTIKKIED